MDWKDGAFLGLCVSAFFAVVLFVAGAAVKSDMRKDCTKRGMVELQGHFYRCEPIKWETGKGG